MRAYRVLEPPVPGSFLGMTFPAYRHLLALRPTLRLMTETVPPPIQPIAVAAMDGDEAIGLALAEVPIEGETEPEILSIFVASAERNQGVGAGLLGAAEDEVRRLGFPKVTTTYTVGKSSNIVERLLASREWAEPELRTLSVQLTVEDTRKLPWLNRLRVRSGCEIIPWAEVTDEEKAHLRRSQDERPWIAPDLVPWRHEVHGYEPITSVALRSPDGIVGWVINHRISADTLRFTCSYIRKDLGRRARILPMYSASIDRLTQTRFTSCTFVAPMRHATMAAFVRRRVQPWASSVRETRGSQKVLIPEQVDSVRAEHDDAVEGRGGSDAANATVLSESERGAT